MASESSLDLNLLAWRIGVFSKIDPDRTARILLLEFIEKQAERLRSRILKNGWDREDVLRTALRNLPYPALVRTTLRIKNLVMDSYNSMLKFFGLDVSSRQER